MPSDTERLQRYALIEKELDSEQCVQNTSPCVSKRDIHTSVFAYA